MEPGFRRIKARAPLSESERKRVLDGRHRETAARAQGYRERAAKAGPERCFVRHGNGPPPSVALRATDRVNCCGPFEGEFEHIP